MTGWLAGRSVLTELLKAPEMTAALSEKVHDVRLVEVAGLVASMERAPPQACEDAVTRLFLQHQGEGGGYDVQARLRLSPLASPPSLSSRGSPPRLGSPRSPHPQAFCLLT